MSGRGAGNIVGEIHIWEFEGALEQVRRWEQVGLGRASVSLANVRPHRACDCGQSSYSEKVAVSLFLLCFFPPHRGGQNWAMQGIYGPESQKTSRRKISYSYVFRTAWRQGHETRSNH